MLNQITIIDHRIVPSLELVIAYNTQAYEVFMAVRALQYRESQESVADFRAQLAEYARIENALIDMHRSHPELLAPVHVARVFAPLKKQYAELLEHTLTQIERKQTQLGRYAG